MYTGPRIVTRGLISAFDDQSKFCHEGTETTFTDLANGELWTLSGGFTRDGDGYLLYDGIDSKIVGPRNFLDQSDLTKNIETSGTGGGYEEYTIECWVRISQNVTGDTTAGWQLIGNNGDLGVGLQLFRNGSKNRVNLGYRTNSNVSCDTCDLSLNQWYHVVGVRRFDDVSTVYSEIYINGVLDYSSIGMTALDVDNPGDGSQPMQFGRTGDRITGYLNGNMPVARIYNTGLHVDEIQNNYELGKQRFK